MPRSFWRGQKMAVSKSTFQYMTSVSINREAFLRNVVLNDSLNKKELRVILHLMTHLDAKSPKLISKKSMSEDLGYSKKVIDQCLETLEIQGLIYMESSGSVDNGYRLAF